MKSLSLLLSLLFVLALGCAAETGPIDGPHPGVAGADAGAKADHGDPCEYDGRYGDGFCDEYCPKPDPDCASEPRVFCDRSPGECKASCGNGPISAEANDNCPKLGEHPSLVWECTCL